MGHQPVPDEQYEQRADSRADKTCALVKSVPTGKDGKRLSGAAKASFVKKCQADAS